MPRTKLLYAYEQIPVMLACNDDHGNFDGNIRMIDIHDSLQLECNFINEDEEDEGAFDFAGLECSLGDDNGVPSLIFGEHKFHYIKRLNWCGNMCWDLFVMYGEDFLPFLNYLHKSKQYSCTEGESRLFNWWEQDKEFGEAELGMIAKFSSTFRL
jgi:hypothetical protein